jgi:predicted HTH domain antitoxin
MAPSDTTTLTIDLPTDFVLVQNRSLPALAQEARTWMVLAAFIDGQISTGKAAEWLGMPKHAIIDLLAQRGIPYLDRSVEEWAEDLAADLTPSPQQEP